MEYIHSEDSPEVLLWRAVGHDVHDDHQLPETDESVTILVVHIEYALLQYVKVLSLREAVLHEATKVLSSDGAVWVFGHKIFKVCAEVLSFARGVLGEEVQVILRQLHLLRLAKTMTTSSLWRTGRGGSCG